MRRANQKGNALIEMTLVGIPVMFILISTFEISRGMWAYHTLAHAVREGTRYAIVRGDDCSTQRAAIQPVCYTSISDLAAVIRFHGVGLEWPRVTLTFRSANAANDRTCVMEQTNGQGTLCSTLTARWPADGDNGQGSPVTVTAQYPFMSALSMLWPGAGSVSFGAVNFPAGSTERIQY